MVQTVREALVAFEPRIDVLDISAESAPEEPNLLLIRINYRIRANNARGNLVYPFYIRGKRLIYAAGKCHSPASTTAATTA